MTFAARLLPLWLLLTAGASPQPALIPPSLAHGTPEWYVSDSGFRSVDYSETEAVLYRFDIKPVTPESGINSGCVIAYGHPLLRPYRFTVVQDTLLFVNGVQVERVMQNDAYISAKKRLSALYKPSSDRLARWATGPQEHGMANAVKDALYALAVRIAHRPRLSSAAALDSIWHAILQFPYAESAATGVHVSSDNGMATSASVTLHLREQRADSSVVVETPMQELDFVARPESIPLPKYIPPIEQTRMALVDDTALYEHTLKSGGLCAFGPHFGGVGPCAMLGRALAVMEEDSLRWPDKVVRLREVLAFPDAAKEFMYNFNAHEYQRVLGGER